MAVEAVDWCARKSEQASQGFLQTSSAMSISTFKPQILGAGNLCVRSFDHDSCTIVGTCWGLACAWFRHGIPPSFVLHERQVVAVFRLSFRTSTFCVPSSFMISKFKVQLLGRVRKSAGDAVRVLHCPASKYSRMEHLSRITVYLLSSDADAWSVAMRNTVLSAEPKPIRNLNRIPCIVEFLRFVVLAGYRREVEPQYQTQLRDMGGCQNYGPFFGSLVYYGT